MTENTARWFLLSGRCADCSRLEGKRLILRPKDPCWELECPFRGLLLLFSVSFGVCGAGGGGISAFDGVYVVWGNARKREITPEVALYWFYFTNNLRRQGALWENKQQLRQHPPLQHFFTFAFLVVFI